MCFLGEKSACKMAAKRRAAWHVPGPAGQPLPRATSLHLPSSPLGACYLSPVLSLPREKSEFLSRRLCGFPCQSQEGSRPCERAPGLLSSRTFTGIHPHRLSCSAISRLFPSSPNQEQTVSPSLLYLAGGVAPGSPKGGEGEAGEVPNSDRYEMGCTTGWISWMWSPKRTGAAARSVHPPSRPTPPV